MALLEIDDLTTLWGAVIADVSVESPQHRAFLALTKPLGLIQNESGSNLLLSAPNAFAKDVLETRLRAILNEALSTKLDQKINIAVTIDETLQEDVVEDVVEPIIEQQPKSGTGRDSRSSVATEQLN